MKLMKVGEKRSNTELWISPDRIVIVVDQVSVAKSNVAITLVLLNEFQGNVDCRTKWNLSQVQNNFTFSLINFKFIKGLLFLQLSGMVGV